MFLFLKSPQMLFNKGIKFFNPSLAGRYNKVARRWKEQSEFSGQRRDKDIFVITKEVKDYLAMLATVYHVKKPICIDFGGGTGNQAISIKKACPNCQVSVFDGSQAMLDCIKNRRIGKIFGSFTEISKILEKNSVDVAVISGALHDVPKSFQPLVIKEIHKVLKPDGILIIAAFATDEEILHKALNRIVLSRDIALGMDTMIGDEIARYFAKESEIFSWLTEDFDASSFDLSISKINYFGTGELTPEQETKLAQAINSFSVEEKKSLKLSKKLSFKSPVQGFVARKLTDRYTDRRLPKNLKGLNLPQYLRLFFDDY